MGKVLLKSGLSMVPEIGHDPKHPRTWVAQFVVASPDGAPTRNDRNAIQQMEYWLQVKQSFTTHNPSVTITHRDNEVFEIMAWLYEHQDWIGGMAFLPAFDANLPLLPYVEIDAAEYERRKAAEPNIDFSLLFRYEVRDESTATQELACAAGACEAIGQNAEAAKDALPVAA